MCDHRGGRRLAVNACNAYSVLISAHNEAPGLGALKNRDALRTGLYDLDIVFARGSGTDNVPRPTHAFGSVPDRDAYPHRAEPADNRAFADIRSGKPDAHPVQYFRKRRH
jgi:hypothetical protein